jgi:hypothetical protein
MAYFFPSHVGMNFPSNRLQQLCNFASSQVLFYSIMANEDA